MIQKTTATSVSRLTLALVFAIALFVPSMAEATVIVETVLPGPIQSDGTNPPRPSMLKELEAKAEQARIKGFSGDKVSLFSENSFSCNDVTSIDSLECEALVALYNATNGSDWFDNSGWLISSDPCSDWYSVECKDGHVRSLWLSSNNLIGYIPSAIGNLSNLANLGMAWNQLSGDLPAEFWNLSGLIFINLYWNYLTGEIPEAISNFENITELDFGKNYFSGPIPNGLWNLEGLTYLLLGQNNFNGEISADIANLTNLTILNLSFNQLSGSLPDELWTMELLQSIELEENQFSGQIPSDISNLDNLAGIILSDNQFSGNLPAEFWALPNLSVVRLANNQFTGELPPEIGNLNLPWDLHLNDNKFSGPIPPEIGNLTSLRTLNISSNQLKGEIPFEITNLQNLNLKEWDYTDIGYNHLYSTDPVVRAFLDEKDPDWESTQTPLSEFTDVPANHWASSYIAAIKNAGITGGCRPGEFCPTAPVFRSDMAIFLERGMNTSDFVPPPATGIFTDVPLDTYYANWVEQLYADGITGGCSTVPMKYCPSATVTREQMAVFLLRAKYGKDYLPPAAQGIFSDVQPGSFFEPWIEQMSVEGITAGCGLDTYCPSSPVTREQMAVFLTRTFKLPAH